MEKLVELLTETVPAPNRRLTLDFDTRSKSRFKATFDDGGDCGVLLPRGTRLKDGDVLRSEQGELVVVRAAKEALSTVRASDPLALTKAAYHLGNRHVSLQIDAGALRYQHDHVLDDMVKGLGLEVRVEQSPFEPEDGAYGGGHSHGSPSEGHGRAHSHGGLTHTH